MTALFFYLLGVFTHYRLAQRIYQEIGKPYQIDAALVASFLWPIVSLYYLGVFLFPKKGAKS